MKSNELNQQEQQSTNGGQMMPPPPDQTRNDMSSFSPDQNTGYTGGADGQGTLTQDNSTVNGMNGNDDNGSPYIG